MEIKKILNNSVVITLDANNKEIIVMGKGIAYGRKPGEQIDERQITKRFILSSMAYPQRILELLSETPPECIEIIDNIIQYAKATFAIELHETLYISIVDHIRVSIERYQEGIELTNKLLWEIKHFYKNEFAIGQYALGLIAQHFNITLREDEAGFIALHIVSAETHDDIQQTYKITHFIQNITHIIKYYFNLEYDAESLDYYRLITHLRFFAKRLLNQAENHNSTLNNDLLDLIKEKYQEAYRCSHKIKTYLIEKYNYNLDSDEILYLTIHIAKITQKEVKSKRPLTLNDSLLDSNIELAKPHGDPNPREIK